MFTKYLGQGLNVPVLVPTSREWKLIYKDLQTGLCYRLPNQARYFLQYYDYYLRARVGETQRERIYTLL